MGQAKQETDTNIGQVTTDLTGAKGDISATKQDREATKAKLNSTVGNLGVQSGLIARNQEELDQLKRQGERNIFELHLTKSKTPTHVGPIQNTLTKTDPKKFKYTLMVVADDKTIEKKDKTADEPVQFTSMGCRAVLDRKSTRLNSSHLGISYAVFCLKKKTKDPDLRRRSRSTGSRDYY